MPDYRITQPKTASLTYIDDWSTRLARAYPAATVTIASCSGVVTGGATLTAVSGTGASATFHLATAGVSGSVPEDIVVTLTATLSNGDIDPRDIAVGVT